MIFATSIFLKVSMKCMEMDHLMRIIRFANAMLCIHTHKKSVLIVEAIPLLAISVVARTSFSKQLNIKKILLTMSDYTQCPNGHYYQRDHCPYFKTHFTPKTV